MTTSNSCNEELDMRDTEIQEIWGEDKECFLGRNGNRVTEAG
jgi:hypothetical protein